MTGGEGGRTDRKSERTPVQVSIEVSIQDIAPYVSL
jgi:hypothetical protein